MIENYVGALVEVEIDPEYIVRLRVNKQTDSKLIANALHCVDLRGRKVTVIEPAPIPEPLNGEVWRSAMTPGCTFTWDGEYGAWFSSQCGCSTISHPSARGYVKIAEGVA